VLTYMRTVLAYKKEEGASAVEYGLLVALIAAVIVLAVVAIGKLVNDSFNGTCKSIKGNTSVSTSASCS
jgi:pilus assembly protein Flp/PilA